MIATRMKRGLPLAAITALVLVPIGAVGALAFGASGAQAATAPVKEVLNSRVGWEVDASTKGNVCTVESKHECQAATPSSRAGGFEYPTGVAGAPNGNVYVTDRGNNRVQELSSSGEFLLMFGKGVNKKGGDVCAKAEESECQAGVAGSAPGQFGAQASSIAVDSGGDVYVLDSTNQRVEKYTAAGELLLSITSSVEHGALETEQLLGNLLAVGGPEDLLYVGELGRVEEFEVDGKWKGEISGLGTVSAVAVDQTSGDIYVSEENSDAIKQFDSTGKLLGEPIKLHPSHTVPPGLAQPRLVIATIAIDSGGRLAVAEVENFQQGEQEIELIFGSIFTANSGQLITEFPVPASFGTHGIGFNGNDQLYAAAREVHELFVYQPKPVAELTAVPAVCALGPEAAEADIAFDCSLKGEVDPWGVKETQVWFQWGRTPALGGKTEPPAPIANKQPTEGVEELPVTVSALVEGLRPNQAIYDRLAGEDLNVKLPELLTGPTSSFTTPIVPAKLVGEPSVQFVTSSSAVLFGELNPENSETEYFFEYGSSAALEGCPNGMTGSGVTHCAEEGVSRTTVLGSTVYGRIGATAEVVGLQPATRYAFRLAAGGEGGPVPVGATVGFTTAPAVKVEAVTGPATAVAATSAVVSGTVNPDGQPATYAFELGVYNGAGTQYGTVFSASTTVAVTPSFMLTGLQAGTMYAYRIAIRSGYGEALGAAATFTTLGLPSVLPVEAAPAQLPLPSIPFPTEPKAPAKCRHGYTRDKHGKCVKVKTKKPKLKHIKKGKKK
jgi:hypothetical protein